MLVEACDLEAAHDGRTRIEEDQRSTPASAGYAKQGVEACTVNEDEVPQFELQLVAGCERADCFGELRSRGEVEISRKADAPCVGKRRNLEFGHHGWFIPRGGTI